MALQSSDTSLNPEVVIDALDPVVALLALIQFTGDRTLLAKYGPALEGTQHKVKEAFVAFGETEAPSEISLEVTSEVRGLLKDAVCSG